MSRLVAPESDSMVRSDAESQGPSLSKRCRTECKQQSSSTRHPSFAVFMDLKRVEMGAVTAPPLLAHSRAPAAAQALTGSMDPSEEIGRTEAVSPLKPASPILSAGILQFESVFLNVEGCFFAPRQSSWQLRKD